MSVHIESALRGFQLTHAVGHAWTAKQTTRDKMLDLLASLGDAATWNNEKHKRLLRDALAAGVVTQEEVATAMAKFSLTYDPLVAADNVHGLVSR